MINEVFRHPAPGPEPLGVAFDGTSLWVSSREAHRLYAMDVSTWSVREEAEVPGAPFGMAAAGSELRVVVGFGDDDDDRYIYRFVRGRGFGSDRIECPDLSGAQLAIEGGSLFLSQAHNRKILAFNDRDEVIRAIDLERVPVGMTTIDGDFYLVTVDRDFTDPQVTTLEARGETAALSLLESIPFGARGLAFDGSRFWTADRRANEIVAFELPAR